LHLGARGNCNLLGVIDDRGRRNHIRPVWQRQICIDCKTKPFTETSQEITA
jgi:hypothetical protein